MLIRRRAHKPIEERTLHLLSDLLEMQPAEARLRPVVLRSLKAQRQEVLAPYPMRTWFDRALGVGERLLGLVVIVFFCWWLFDGYGRDWWHARSAKPTPTVPVHQRVVEAPAPTVLPAPTVVDVAVSLPVVDERWARPAVELDYLTPARMYIRPLQPGPTPAPSVAPQPRDLRPTNLSMPTASVDSSIVEVFVQDGAWQVADYAVGYHHNTGIVGTSNMVLAGHAGLRGGVFRHLDRLKPGDAIFVDADGQRFEYRVRGSSKVWPDQVDVMFPTEQAQLTLLTCTNWDTQRLVVVADFVGPMSNPAPAGGN